MMQNQTARTRAALFIGAALLATPAFAQDAPTQTVTPPPVVSTVPETPAPAPAPTFRFAPATPTVQAVPETPTAQTPPREATRTATRRTSTTRQVTRAAAPAATTPASAPQPAPAVAPVEQSAPTAVTPPVEAPVAPAQTETTATTAETAPAQTALWPWLLGGALVVAGVIAALLFRRRREEDEVYEERYEPVAAAQPVAAPERTYVPRHEPEVAPLAAAAPAVVTDDEGEPLVIAEDAEIVKADAEDLADLTAAAPVAHRPWLEFGMRPVRAGTSSDEALVDIELTVANSGDMPANNVRISTFLLKSGDSTDMEQLMIERSDDSSVPPVTIAAGEGTRVDATLAVRRDELEAQGNGFSPVVVADARYTMADGTEGRTSATFRVGLWNDGDGIEPIGIGRPQMHDNVAAELHGTPAHT